jgi:hypothetical protein
MIKTGPITATKLRIILAVSLLLIQILASFFVAAAHQSLKSYASEVSQTTANAEASQDSIQTLQKIQQELLINKDAIQRTNEIVADSQSYQYQDQIITDLNNYAIRSNVTITNVDFLSAESSATAPSTQPSGTTATPSAPAPTGVKSTGVSVTLKNPVNYEDLLRFIKSIEENLTKMQISRVSLAKDSGGGVTSGALNIEIYVR